MDKKIEMRECPVLDLKKLRKFAEKGDTTEIKSLVDELASTTRMTNLPICLVQAYE